MKTLLKVFLLLFFSIASTAGIYAQRTVTGTVVDKDQQPVPSVNVVVTGTTQGTTTDFAGKYSIPVPPGAKSLTFSYIGMEPQEIIIGALTVINVTMTESAIGLGEIVVVGYQTKQKSNLTGSVSTISSRQLENRPVAKLTQLLPGLAPGLTVTRNNPGRIGASDVGIRIGGITSRSNPDILIVIDGVPQENSSALNTINYNDVESISILKDAEAAIYGSRASGGVMVITTKRGKGSNLSASVSSSFAAPNIYRRTTNMLQMLELQQNAWASQNETPFFGYPDVFKYVKDNNLTFDKIKNNDFKYVFHGNAPFPDTPYLVFGHTDWMEEMYRTAVT
ncbi:MAG: TonB-dependent receptor plug domain-containing protein, partial [Bacteroidales bacterium]